MTTLTDIFDRAAKAHAAGDLPTAQSLYQQAIAFDPASPLSAQAIYRLGVLDLQQGRPQQALDAIQKAIQLSPGEPRFNFGLGWALAGLQRFAEAIPAYRKALEVAPKSTDVHLALGLAEESLGHWQNASDAYHAALAINPDFPEALCNLGNCQSQLKNDDAAEPAYRHAIAVRPHFAGAHSNLGNLLVRRGKHDEALAELRHAVLLEPAVTTYRVNLGALLCQRREFAEAQSILAEAVRLASQDSNALYNLGSALLGLADNRAAADLFRRAIAINPRQIDAHINLSHACLAIGDPLQARQACLAALAIDPQSVPALSNAGCISRMLGDLDAAAELLNRAQSLAPDSSPVANNLGDMCKDAGDLDAAIAWFAKAVALDPTNAMAHSNLAYSLHFQAADGQTILDEALRWDARHAAPVAPDPATARTLFPTENLSPNPRLRIGFVSGDFRNHCQSFFTLPLFSHLDRHAVEIFCYSNVPRPDDFTARFQSLADHWQNIQSMDDDHACRHIRADRLDILVDLALHMAYGRPGIFARRAAPVQVAWLAYPGTTGLAAMDFLLADPHLIPPQFEHLYRERICRLPDTFWCYDPLCDGPPVNELPALSKGHLTFGSLNAPCKISDHAIALWSAILASAPNSRLLLMAPEGSARTRLLARFARHGTGLARISFVPFQPRPRYLETYHHIDLALDPFPYNGHTTSLDACWMGVPVPTRVGQTAVSRGGLSQLSNLGFPEWACPTDESYIHTVTTLAADLPSLATLRRELRPRMQQSPLMNTTRFARAMESTLRQIATPPR